MLITTPAALERTAEAVRAVDTLKHVVTVVEPGASGANDFWSLLARAAPSAPTADTSPDDPALLIYTSGTTGNPKGALHAQRVLLGHLPGVMVPHDFFPQAGDRFWTPADWAWAGGLLDVLFPSLFHGVPVVGSVRTKFEPEWAFDFMARHGVRNTFMPPTALRLMRQVPNPRAHFAYSVRSIGTGGEKLGEDMMAWGRETFGLELSEFYGQTEVNLVVGNSPRLFPVRAGSMGRAIPGHTVEVVDEQRQRPACGQARRRRRAPARPRHVPAILEEARGDGGEIQGRLVPARRRGREGRGGLLLVPGPRRRHHQLRRLPHRPRRGRGVPDDASRRGAGGSRRARPTRSAARSWSPSSCLRPATSRARRSPPRSRCSSRSGSPRTSIRARCASSRRMPMTVTGKIRRKDLRELDRDWGGDAPSRA